MTFEEKQIKERAIVSLIMELAANQATDGILFLHGDAEYQNASFTIKGDAKLLANTIQHHIKHNEEFRRFIFATIGSYLSQEPEHEKEFFGGILALKTNLGVN